MSQICLWLSIATGFLAAAVWFAATVVNHRQEVKYLDRVCLRVVTRRDRFFRKLNGQDPDAPVENAPYLGSIHDHPEASFYDPEFELIEARVLQNRLNAIAAILTGTAVMLQSMSTFIQNIS